MKMMVNSPDDVIPVAIPAIPQANECGPDLLWRNQSSSSKHRIMNFFQVILDLFNIETGTESDFHVSKRGISENMSAASAKPIRAINIYYYIQFAFRFSK